MNDEHTSPATRRPLLHKPPGLIRRVVAALVEKFLVLYYVGADPATPGWAKAILVTGVASFFSVDVLLDVFALPIGAEASLGSVLLAAGAFVFSIRRRHLDRARATRRRWFREDQIIDVTTVPPPPPPAPPLLPP
jgi:hypothetical protein